MTPKTNHKMHDGEGQAIIQDLFQKRIRLSIKYTLIQMLEEKIETFANAVRNQQTSERRD